MHDANTLKRQRVLEILFAAIDEINEILPDEGRLEKSDQTHLFDKQGKLDSMGLVNFIVLVEQGVAEEFDLAITLADEKAFSRETSPFRTVASLTDYVIEQLNGSEND